MKSDLLGQADEVMREHEQDLNDKRYLSGKYSPKTGTCKVCSGKVVAEISFPNDGRMGGPPPQGHVSGWHCEACFIAYWRCPP